MPSARGLRQILPRQTIKMFMAAKVRTGQEFVE